MKFNTQIKPTNNFLLFLADKLQQQNYSLALLAGETLETEIVGEGYERETLLNVIIKSVGKKVVFLGDNATFFCKGKGYSAKKLALILSGDVVPLIVALADIEVTLYDGDQVVLDLSKGFFEIVLEDKK